MASSAGSEKKTEQKGEKPAAKKAPAKASSGDVVAAAEKSGRGLSKVQEGYVTSNKMQKTVVVSIVSYKKHPQYGKYVRRTKKYMAHDERSECQIGDRVQIVETRPLSKLKRYRVQKIIERAV